MDATEIRVSVSQVLHLLLAKTIQPVIPLSQFPLLVLPLAVRNAEQC